MTELDALRAENAGLREDLARACDPAAFEYHPAEARRAFAALQWEARRFMAYEVADRLLASEWLESLKRDTAAVALEEAAKLVRPNITIKSMYSAAGVNITDGDPMVAGNRALHRAADRLDKLAITTRNPRTPGEETA